MNKNHTFAITLFSAILFLLLFFTPSISNAQRANGEIQGKVVDAETGEELIGASVFIKKSGPDSLSGIVGTVTDVNGRFQLTGVPLGKQILSTSYIGYNRTELSINVQEGILATVTIKLQANAEQLEEIVIRGSADVKYSSIRNSTDVQLVNAMKFSEGVLAGISNEQIVKSVDRDASQIVQRISGVSLVDRFVVVRGMDTRYNLTMINGIIGPSSEENSRSFSYDALPTGVIDRIELEKSPGPHLPAMWGGGVVKIFTRSFTNSRQFNFDFTGGYRTGGSSFTDNFVTYDGSNKDWYANGLPDRRLPQILRQKFFDYPNFDQYPTENLAISRSGIKVFTPKQVSQDFDKRVSFSYYDTWKIGNLRLNSLTAGSYTYERLYQEVTQLRNGANYAADSVVTDGSSYIDSIRSNEGEILYREYPTLSAVDSLFEEQVRVSFVQSLGVQLNETNNLSATFFYNRFGTDRAIIRRGFEDISASGEISSTDPIHRFYTYSYEQREILLGQLGGSHASGKHSIDWTGGFSKTTNNVPNLQQFLFVGVGDDASLRYGVDNEGNRSFTTFLNFETEELSATGRVDYKYDITDGMYIRAGGLFDRKERSFFSYRYTPLDATEPDRVQGGTTEILYRPWLSIDSILSPANYSMEGWFLDYPRKQGGAYFFDDESAEGYVAINYPIIQDKLTFYGGVRAAKFSRTLYDRYNLPTSDVANVQGQTVFVEDQDKTYWLPSGSLKYDMADGKYILRAVYGRTVDRPQFREQAGASGVNPGGSVESVYDFRSNEIFLGNPVLRNTVIDNADLRLEFYPKSGEFMSIGGFYKYLDKPIQRIARSAVGSAVNIYYQNADFATVWGIELEVRKKFDFLKVPIIRNMSINLNASYIESEASIVFFDSTASKLRLQGASPYLVNSALYYESLETGTLISAIYNLTWDRVRDYSDNIEIGNLVEARRHQLDLVFKQRITGFLTFKAGVQDVLNQRQRFYRDQNENYNYNPGAAGIVPNEDGQRIRGEFVEREVRPGAYYTVGLTLTLKSNKTIE